MGRRADDGDGERSDGVGEGNGASGAAGGEARGKEGAPITHSEKRRPRSAA